MADLQNFSVTDAPAVVQAGAIVVLTQAVVNGLSQAQKTALASLLVPDVLVAGQFCDSRTGAVLRDFSAQFGLFDAFRQLSRAQRQDILDRLVVDVLHAKAGL